jgi:aspartyl-tRNA synthetase
MTRSTPEGARDYLVPSRVQPGTFYALPQSPQIFKQLLMVSGFEKYFQIVRCFRDEDLRADRQPEFTQIDLEMSFPQQERIFEVVEPLVQRICEVAGYEWRRPSRASPTPRPCAATAATSPTAHPAHASRWRPVAGAGQCRAAAGGHPHSRTGAPSRKERDELKAFGQERGLRVYDDSSAWSAIIPSPMAKVRERCGAGEDDPAGAGHLGRRTPRAIVPKETVYQACGQLRLHCAQKFNDRHKLLDPKNFQFLWVVDFPMFEWDEEENRWNAAHHPFTSVHDEDLEKLTADPARCRAKSYDLVLNGVELGSGSIRIHRRDVQAKVFAALGFSDEEARRRFGFLLDALEYGAPPHGGIALGLDRLVMILAGETPSAT